MIKRVDKRLQAVQCLTGNKIKIIACITMLIDHFSKIFLESIMNDKLFPLYLAGGMSTEQFYGIDAFQKNILNGIGTIAFPLFCLLLSEGFFYTKNRKRYIGSYAKGAQEQFLKTAHPVWLSTGQYETWAKEVILPEKYKEVTDRYGDAPGNLLATEDSIAIACLRFGNVLLFPQPRPALGDDDFKLVHGMPVAPPHSYLAPYLYMQKGFKADALIHFGTHGNLEYTPGKNVGLSQADWSEALVGNLPHFYFYTTGNVGEGIIAKRRTHAVLVTHLTPPYAESGMRQRYNQLLEDIHKLLDEGTERHRMLGMRVKKETVRLGLHRDLELDSVPDKPFRWTYGAPKNWNVSSLFRSTTRQAFALCRRTTRPPSSR